MQKQSPLDQFLTLLNRGLNTLSNDTPRTSRPSPADTIQETSLDEHEREQISALMRVNHAGEIAAQGLYHGQSAITSNESLKSHLLTAAQEEYDHLSWCQQRLTELGGRTSYLTPAWYWGSVAIGVLASVAGDQWSLGFVHETEAQVHQHLQSHLDQLPSQDNKTRAILEQMQIEEQEHGEQAMAKGGRELPPPVKTLMGSVSTLMTSTSYRW